MKRKDEICYQEVIYYADFDSGIKILINWQILSSSMANHFEDNENMQLPISW